MRENAAARCCRPYPNKPPIGEVYSPHGTQVRDAERRLAIQHTFIERLRASGRNSSSAEEALEIMRDILRDLYHSRMLLRRKVVNRQARTDSSTIKKATKNPVGVRAVASAPKSPPRY